MSRKIFLFPLLIFFPACKQETRWSFSKEIKLTNIQPIGLTVAPGILWLSDVKNNRMVKIDTNGNILKEIPGFQRPMHFSTDNNKIYVPEYLTDTVRIIDNEKIDFLPLAETLDAPSGISVKGNTIAIADFYNHRIIMQQDGKTTIIGKEGHAKGELYYPTDVELFNNKIYVADAYNNRVQVFDKQGKIVQIIGDNDSINTAIGLAVTAENIFITDFENSKILIYDIEGKLLQKLAWHLDKPTDIFVSGNSLYICNYQGQYISVFHQGPRF